MTKEKIFNYLKEQVMNRHLYTDEVVYHPEGGKMEGTYEDDMIFSDLSASENSIRFHMTTVTREKVYHIDHHGDRERLIKDFTGTSVFAYELALRKSTGEITGFSRALSSTVKDHTMEGVVYGVHKVKLINDELKWEEKQLFYRDMPAGENLFRPAAFDSEVRFYKEEGKLIFEYIPRYYDVDPETMEKSLSKDVYPAYISREK